MLAHPAPLYNPLNREQPMTSLGPKEDQDADKTPLELTDEEREGLREPFLDDYNNRLPRKVAPIDFKIEAFERNPRSWFTITSSPTDKEGRPLFPHPSTMSHLDIPFRSAAPTPEAPTVTPKEGGWRPLQEPPTDAHENLPTPEPEKVPAPTPWYRRLWAFLVSLFHSTPPEKALPPASSEEPLTEDEEKDLLSGTCPPSEDRYIPSEDDEPKALPKSTIPTRYYALPNESWFKTAHETIAAYCTIWESEMGRTRWTHLVRQQLHAEHPDLYPDPGIGKSHAIPGPTHEPSDWEEERAYDSRNLPLPVLTPEDIEAIRVAHAEPVQGVYTEEDLALVMHSDLLERAQEAHSPTQQKSPEQLEREAKEAALLRKAYPTPPKTDTK